MHRRIGSVGLAIVRTDPFFGIGKKKRRFHPNMKIVGGSLVKIMKFVAAGKDAKESNGTFGLTNDP